MLPVFGIGAVLGIMWGVLNQNADRDGQREVDGLEQQLEQQVQLKQQQQHGQQQPEPLQDNPAQCSTRRTKFSRSRIAAMTCGGLLCITAAAAVSIFVGQRRHSRNRKHSSRHADGRIPLKDLIRFKERQWFVEELENAREADPNAMLRLAKMYLNGQGCQRNIGLAQEWVRKARSMGVPATLDELYATDDPDPHTKLRTLAAIEERRRALRQLNTAAKTEHSHSPQLHTAAA